MSIDQHETSPAPESVNPGRVAVAGIAALALLGVALLYLLFPSSDYTGDGTLFANLVRDFRVEESTAGRSAELGADRTEFYRLFLHPHHLLYGPLASFSEVAR